MSVRQSWSYNNIIKVNIGIKIFQAYLCFNVNAVCLGLIELILSVSNQINRKVESVVYCPVSSTYLHIILIFNKSHYFRIFVTP